MIPWCIARENQGSSGREFRVLLARYFEVPLDAEMAGWIDQRCGEWHLVLKHPSWPDRGANPAEEQWDYGLEHAHLMDLGCHVPVTDLACEHGRISDGQRGGERWGIAER